MGANGGAGGRGEEKERESSDPEDLLMGKGVFIGMCYLAVPLGCQAWLCI